MYKWGGIPADRQKLGGVNIMRIYGFDDLPNGDKQLHTYDVDGELVLMMLLEKLKFELKINKKGKPVLDEKK